MRLAMLSGDRVAEKRPVSDRAKTASPLPEPTYIVVRTRIFLKGGFPYQLPGRSPPGGQHSLNLGHWPVEYLSGKPNRLGWVYRQPGTALSPPWRCDDQPPAVL